jgi:carboxymethylenebutenolidase
MEVEVTSDGQAYESYIAFPTEGGPYPGIVLIHSFNGFERGYKTLTDKFAAEGFVVLAVGWQTFTSEPSEEVMTQLVEDSATFLSTRADVDPERLGLTGFCAGGKYTMLLLPQIKVFAAGVAWYGFPYSGDPTAADLIADLDAPLLIIHGSDDRSSRVVDIYRYVTSLAEAGKYFELKVYQGEPHGFMIEHNELSEDEVALDAYHEMVDFFKRKLVVKAEE